MNDRKSLLNFKDCAESAPEGCYDQAKQIHDLIGDACDELMRGLRAIGLKADACDAAFDLEAAIYAYVRKSNPDNPVFPVAEGFGEAMSGPARERVLRQAVASREQLRALGVV